MTRDTHPGLAAIAARQVLPAIEMPTIEDIERATDELFPNTPSFGEPSWRLWTDEERRQINRRAYEIMVRRKTKH